MPSRPLVAPSLLLSIVGLIVLAAYWPGLHGGFLFDDFGSLPALGAGGPVDNWPTFWRYVTSGTADPTGRPLTLLTFLLDARDWPAVPFPFKRTNLILHLFNGALLYALQVRLGRQLAIDERRAQLAAVLGCALWLLHPLLVSTTLYIVQREAMLPATCVIAGLLTWLHGRHSLLEGRLKSGAAWSAVGLAGFTLLGTLAKANGALLPLFALLIEGIVLRGRHPMPSAGAQRIHRAILIIFGIVPATVLLGFIAWTAAHGLWKGGPVGIRAWSTGQRLLTEPRVLMDYLALLWLPRPFSSGLFNDQYAASTSLLHPISTLTSVLCVLALIGAALYQRRRHPALALAVLFYFSGQLLESSAIPLELYFEHRNYMPALLMFWPLGLWLADTRTLRMLKIALMLALPLALSCMTYARAAVWGDVQMQALVWASINPASPRAQANAAEVEIQAGRPWDAERRLERLFIAQPDQAQIVFNLIDARCQMSGLHHGDIDDAVKAMRNTANVGSLFTKWFDTTLPLAMSGQCPGLTPAALVEMIQAGLQNPRLADAGPQQDLTYLLGRASLAQRRPDEALSDYIQALDLIVRPDFALAASSSLGAAGYPAQGLSLLDHYCQIQNSALPPGLGMPMLHAWVLSRQHYWQKEITRLHAILNLRASASTIPSATSPDEPCGTSRKQHTS